MTGIPGMPNQAANNLIKGSLLKHWSTRYDKSHKYCF